MVTGSSYLLETADGVRGLVDCGMFQGSKAIEALNRREFPYRPSELNFVLLTHAHIDHSGLLPRLCREGFKGPILCTKVTSELLGIMLPDSGHIQEFEAEIANRKGQRAGKQPMVPLYTVEDAYKCLKQLSPVPYNEEVVLSPKLKVRFRDAGHILGSSMLEIWAEEEKPVKFLFSGDLGQPDQPIIRDPSIVHEADYVIVESTYGAKRHEHYDREERLAEIVNETVQRGGNVIIPAFAVGRTQTLLYYLHKLFKARRIPDIPVIIDSPLAISATDIFLHNPQEYDAEASDMLYKDHDNPLTLPQLKFTRTTDESKALNKLDRPAIIISASGMADAGRILHHLKHNLWRPESSVLFVGYQAEGSLGRRLLEGAKRVKIMGEQISVKARIYNLEGFSAHADQEQILKWLGNFNAAPAATFILHGEEQMSVPLAKAVSDQLGFPTYVPRLGETAVVSGREWRIEPSDIAVKVPAVERLREFLRQLEHEYEGYREQLEQMVAKDAGVLDEILRRLEKVRSFVKKNLENLF